jgi:hypothetical protein
MLLKVNREQAEAKNTLPQQPKRTIKSYAADNKQKGVFHLVNLLAVSKQARQA